LVRPATQSRAETGTQLESRWLAIEKAEKEQHWKRVKELEGHPKWLLLFALEKLIGKKAADVPRARPPVPPRLG
jgi:hypothetical protein